MSERQQIINKYISNLSNGVSVAYQLNFLRNENDSAARQMICNSLKQISSKIDNQEVISAMESALRGSSSRNLIGGMVKKEKDEENSDYENTSGIEKDYGQRGMTYLGSLHYQNALHDFDKARKSKRSSNKFYSERCHCCFLLSRFDEAYALAKKTQKPLLIFLMSMVSGHFSEAADVSEYLSLIGSQSPLVSTYDLFQLIMLAKMASKPATDVVETFGRLTASLPSYTFPEIERIVNLFNTHEYGKAVTHVVSLSPSIEQSIYTVPVMNSLIEAITQNSLLSFIRPFGTIRISDVISETGLSREKVNKAIIAGVRSGELTGRIDPVNDVFIRSSSRLAQVQASYDQLMIIRQRFETALWNKEQANVKFH